MAVYKGSMARPITYGYRLLLKLRTDMVTAIDSARGGQSRSAFIRDAVEDAIERRRMLGQLGTALGKAIKEDWPAIVNDANSPAERE